ncbi:MAG TPA: DNA polymerase III subunit chi [Allosphingosinicella sp.]|nr:DNA polymerase III subunit chi [Allosphingosinicella sp.]
MIVNFYHLTTSPLERVLPTICQGLLARGEKLLVVAPDAQLARLDEQLWTFAPDSFLPHGRDPAAAQPILLSSTPNPLNGATNVALADGEWREEALGFERAYYFFDSSGLDPARALWRELKQKPEVEARYWKQVDGRWIEGP